MLADAVSQFLDFFDQLLPRHCFEIVVHGFTIIDSLWSATLKPNTPGF
jgi:hypothetical protein